MIGENARDSGVGSKKRSLTSPGMATTSEKVLLSPPTKRLKQARLPFTPISSPSPNQCDKSSVTDPLPSKKRKLSGTDKSPATKLKGSDVKLSAKKPAENPTKKFFAKKVSAAPVTPKNSRAETIDLDPEVTSSCEDTESGKQTSSSATPKRSQSSRPKSLDSFLQTTQQPQVSTSDDVIDILDHEDEDLSSGIKESLDEIGNGKTSSVEVTAADTEPAPMESSQLAVEIQTPASPLAKAVTSDGIRESDEKLDGKTSSAEIKTSGVASSQLESRCPEASSETTSPPASQSHTASEDKDAETQEVWSELDVSMTSSHNDTIAAGKLSYDADLEDGDNDEDENEPRTIKSSEASSEAESSTGGPAPKGSPLMPGGVGKALKKTPLSAKALKKLKEKEQLREEKMRLRMEKKRKLEEEEAERKRLKLELKRKKEQEREEVRRQKQAEKDVKQKEKQLKKEQEEKEKEDKRMAKEEERKKKQEIIDAKMEEKRKKTEERQRVEEEKQKLEEEKREKQAKQKNMFKSFFKEAAVPAKKPQEKSCGWFAPFQVKEDMVLAPLLRCCKPPTALEEFDAARQNQNSNLLYLDELKRETYVAGRTGRTPHSASEETESSRQTAMPSVGTSQQDGESQDVIVVSEMPAEPAKKLTRMKCKLLQFHENYRPPYYGTWRKKSEMINPRNYLKKDEDMLDYEVDSDEEWEEPGESLSHSEGEDDGEDVDDGGDSDDGFFVPHGYLSEDEGCEDEEEIESWKEKRAAKAKSWEIELKRQQGVLKPILIGCVWVNDSTPSTTKTLDTYKIIALATVPIDTGSKKEVQASTEAHTKEETSKTSAQPKASGNEGVSLKRPVPAEAMPDLIRLVHGNTAGIKTLQREFREYWRLKELSKRPGHASPRPETPSVITEAGQSVKSSPDVAQGTNSPLLGVTSNNVQQTSVVNDASSVTVPLDGVETPIKDSTPRSKEWTPEISSVTQSSPANPTSDAVECSISKRQLLITIGAIAVRERRPVFPRTCWYVHQHLLEKYNLQDLTIPSQWQSITKPPKAQRAESPLIGHSLPGYGTQTPSGYLTPTQGSLLTNVQENQLLHGGVHQPMPPLNVLKSSTQMLHSSGITSANGLLGSMPVRFAVAGSNLPTGVNLQPSMPQPGGVALPFQLQAANGMSACEIMQRLSATVPMQHVQAPPTTLPASPAHMFNPIPSSSQMHYLNMLPKVEMVPISPAVGLSMSQINQAATGQVIKVPRTSPNDIKAMLSSQAIKQPLSTPEIITKLESKATNVESPSSAHSSDLDKSSTSSAKSQDESAALPPAQKPGVKTLKSFFNISVKPLPKPQTEVSEPVGEPKETGQPKGEAENEECSQEEDIVCDTERLTNCTDGVEEETGQGNCEEIKVVERI
ncbi:chromatin assembly factor 1 subunit A-like [Acanthaster planci]|uniref:Chromatin assembly factor 1 subunit A-like n=1 Tax=Acanthaster planci TaxID=133434 RepID=A0A8B7ZJT7_ACAPL|nr:chromatin assembly factor 1 subunit A-like [Acanthaster planci]